MSKESYSKWWLLTKDQLANLQKYDRFMKDNTKPTKSRVMASCLVSGLYVKYCMIVQDMDACLDQTAQVQKSFTIRKLMDAAVTRLHELKEALTEIDLSELHCVDGALIELKLIPHDIEILNPALLFPREEKIQDMWERIQKGERLYTPPPPPTPPPEKIDSLDFLLNPEKYAEKVQPVEEKPAEKEVENQEPPPEEQPKEEKKSKKKQIKKFVIEPKVLTEEEIEAIKKNEQRSAILKLIQAHERARQARLYIMDKIRLKKLTPDPNKVIVDKQKSTPDHDESDKKAAITFQRFYRGHAVRRKMARREEDRRYLIGMTTPSWKSNEEFEKIQRNIERRREIVKQHIKDYIDTNIKEKDRVMRVIAPGLMEDIGDEIREWFYQWYLTAKTFDKIPPEENGGTVLVVRCETMTPAEWLVEVERQRKEKEKLKQSGGKNKEKEAAEKKKKEMEKKKREEEQKRKEKEAKAKAKKKKEDFAFKFGESEASKLITKGFREYRILWSHRKDEDNPEDKLYMDMITQQKCYEMQLEVREKVDKLMRIELDLLNEALALDKSRGKKKGKGKKNKNKHKKGKKGKKGKKQKDLTGNRTTEDLFQELVDCGIIHTYPITHLSSFKGDFSYSNYEKRQKEFDPLPSLGDIRQIVALDCILPMGVEVMTKPKSVLIAGPRKCGKHLLANAVFTETKCVLFDLSPPVLAGKYTSKQETKMLLHLINKMSRLLQPSIIFFDGAEKPFYKKVPKEEKALEPKKMGKLLYKGIVKTIKPEDKVLVLGISGQPFAAKQKGLLKAYERIILVPRTDYGSAYLYWYELLMSYHAVDRNIDVSSLAKLSVNYPMGEIRTIVETLLQPRRIIQLSYKPLKQEELFDLMISSKSGPVSDKDFNKFTKWFGKTPLQKRRGRFMIIAEKKREAEAKQAEKAKAKAAAKGRKP